jgi:cytidine deaminase
LVFSPGPADSQMGRTALDPAEAESLLEAAREARRDAYAPYSGFGVGAALLDADGRVYRGTNVENASYGLTTCAERSALVSAVSQGVRRFRAIAVAGPGTGPCPPCGSCRQLLHEFEPELAVVVEGADGAARTMPLSELLPESFGPGVLKRQGRDAEEQ